MSIDTSSLLYPTNRVNSDLLKRICRLGFFGHTLQIPAQSPVARSPMKHTQSLSNAFDNRSNNHILPDITQNIPNKRVPSYPNLNGTSSSPVEDTDSHADSNTLVVKCEVKTRIPSEWGGHHHLLLYSNNQDSEEHLALVYGNEYESTTLESVRNGETARDRIIRGAKPLENNTSISPPNTKADDSNDGLNNSNEIVLPPPPPLARIHSCCFTGETLGSLRCDCKDQLQEAMRLIGDEQRGVILYLKQEGRGIGLLEKMR